MKHLFKYTGIISLMIFSFYYTHSIAIFMQSKTYLMQKIYEDKKTKKVESVNAIIDDNYIIPGLNGIDVDLQKSYKRMLKIGSFDENYLSYEEIIPSISLNDNIEKIIKKANPLKRSVSLIINNIELLDYCLKNDIKTNYLITEDNLINNKNIELINNENDNSFYKIEKYLNSNNKNKNICVINDFNDQICRSNGKYLIEPTYIINDTNLATLISEIDNGDILGVDLSKINFIILINKLKYRDLRIDYLSNLVSEKYQSL